MNDPLGLFDDEKKDKDPLGLFEDDKPNAKLAGQSDKLLDGIKAGVSESLGAAGDLAKMFWKPGSKPSSLAGEFYQGGAETAGTVATGAAAPIVGLAPAGIQSAVNLSKGEAPNFQQNYEHAVDNLTYAPRTEIGQEGAAVAGDFANRNLIALGPMAQAPAAAMQRAANARVGMKGMRGAVGTGERVPAAVRPNIDEAFVQERAAQNPTAPQAGPLPDTIPVTPEGQGVLSPQDAQFKQLAEAKAAREAELAKAGIPVEGRNPADPFGQMKQQLDTPQSVPNESSVMAALVKGLQERPMTAEEIQRAGGADKAIAARQAQLEFEVKQRGGLDFNAAERARQEQAPTGYDEHVAGQTGDRVMGATAQGLVDPATGAQRGIRAENPEVRQGSETLYQDPAGQTFRGDPRDPMAQLGLERQKEAGTNALEHDIATKRGQPLELLTKDDLRRSNEGPQHPGLEHLVQEQFKQELTSKAVENNPFYKKAVDRVTKQEELITKLSEQVQQGKATAAQLKRALRDLENLELVQTKIHENLTKGLGEGKKPVPFNFKKQGGGINVKMFSPDYWRESNERNGFKLTRFGDGANSHLVVHHNGKEVGSLSMSARYIGDEPFGEAMKVYVDPEFRGKGLSEAMYKAFTKHDTDVMRSTNQTDMGKGMWNKWEREGKTVNIDGHSVLPAEKRSIQSPGNKQRGAIDPDLLTLGFSKLFHGGKEFKIWDPKTIGTGEGYHAPPQGPGLYAADNANLAKVYVKYGGKDGALSEMAVDTGKFINPALKPTPDQLAALKRAEAALDALGLRASSRGVRSALSQTPRHLMHEARQAMIDSGIDGMFQNLGDTVGKEVVIFNPDVIQQVSRADTPIEKATGTIRSPGNKQLGALLIGRGRTGMRAEALPPGERPAPRPDGINNPLTPETIAAADAQRRFAQRFPVRNKALDEFDVVRTKEEAISLSKGIKDILPDIGQKKLGSGINFQAAMSNSPALKFARTVFRDARVGVEQFSKRFVTAKDTGLSPVWTKLKSSERVAVMEALQAGDRHQMPVSDAIMDRMGFNEHQRQFVKTFYEADKTLFDRGNSQLAEVGLKAMKERTGHFPGIFTGAYKSLVMDGKKAVGVIATDTRAQHDIAKASMQDRFPNATFVEQKRASLTGTANRYYSDIFSGMSDVLEMLGKEDPRFQEVQEIVADAITQSNNRLFNFNSHELAKKGVVGNEGNKPWLSPERNANDAFKALVRYFEEGAQHHELQVPLKNVRDLANSPEMTHLPNTLKYLDDYMKKITGDDLSPLGGAINTILDTPFKLLPTMSWGQGRVSIGVGVGPSVPLKLAGAIKNNMSQLFMGWGNYMFTASQLIQPGQTGLPFLQLAAGRLGLNVTHTTRSMGRGAVDFMMAFTEHTTGERMDVLPAHQREAFQYAMDRGLFDFSEMERAYQGTQSKAGRVKDQVAEFNIQFAERMTRTPMFMAFTDLLHRGGLDMDKAMPIAENLTQLSMVDYHAWERPMVYSKMGVLGQFAGGLTTFKHSQVSQQIKLGKEAIAPTMGKRQILPITASVTAMLALAGITGTPFYNELDTAYQYLTNKFGGEAKTIRESFLENSPEWLNSGLVSNATNLNIQGKFSAADMIAATPAQAASPQLAGFGNIVINAIDLAKNGGDAQSVRNLLMSATPSGPLKGIMENQVSRDADNNLIGREGLPIIDRTDSEWNKRMATGLRPQREAVERESTWAARQKQAKDVEAQKSIAETYRRSIINDDLPDDKAERLENEYDARKGDIKTLLDMFKGVEIEKTQNEKERMQGIPSTSQGVKRYEYFNK